MKTVSSLLIFVLALLVPQAESFDQAYLDKQLLRQQTRARYLLAKAQDNLLYVVLTDSTGGPRPSMTVYIVHNKEGRSAPQVSDESGLVLFHGFLVGMLGSEYVLEVYAGKTLLRQWVLKLKKGPNKIAVSF